MVVTCSLIALISCTIYGFRRTLKTYLNSPISRKSLDVPPPRSHFQNDFLLPSAKLCVADGMACLPKVIEAVEAARAVDMPIIWVVREHDPSGIDVDSESRP